jgi:hypothetical protein
MATMPDQTGAREIDLNRVWTGVAGEVWARRRGPVERTIARLLHSPGLARALAATPSLVMSWLLATAGIFVIGIIATTQSDDPWVALLAPGVAAVGVAFAYGPGIDPAFELSESMAVPTSLVLIARCAIVFGLNAALGFAGSIATGATAALTFCWLAPMTMLAALALAVALMTKSSIAGAATALCTWAMIVLVRGIERNDIGAAASPGDQLALYLLAAILFAAITYLVVSRKYEGLPW